MPYIQIQILKGILMPCHLLTTMNTVASNSEAMLENVLTTMDLNLDFT